MTGTESSPAWTVSTSANVDDLEPTGDQPDPLKRNVLQWRRLTTAQRDPIAVFTGQAVDVIGFVRHAPADGPTQFTVARFVVRCCISDAKTTGLVVDTPGGNALSDGTWVRVRGLFASGIVDGEMSLVIKPARVDLIREPRTAYLDGLFGH